MKIACVDKTAADRVTLQKRLDEAYEQCRSAIGHLTLSHHYPVSKDEVLLGQAPDVVAVGKGYTIEEAYSAARAIRNAFAHVPIIVFLDPSNFSLRTLRRFQRVANEVFSLEDPPIRLIHKLMTFEEERPSAKAGKVLVISGVKGGVGTTSVVSGLAHAAEALGKSAVVIDLSPMGAFVQYMSTQRWQSPDYAAALVDGMTPDSRFVERCLTTAPNGVNVLLPPTGGTDIRELWLRDKNRFEITLNILDILEEMFDVILVDMASAEGVLPFALCSRAHANLLVTSNDPASVHLLNSRLSELSEIPGDYHLQILVNMSSDAGLTRDDILDFLCINESFSESMALLEPLTFDPRGRNWIGTGNTFYTECASSVQQILDDALTTLLLSPEELEAKQAEHHGLFAGIWRLAKRAIKKKPRVQGTLKALPDPTQTGETYKKTALRPLSAASPNSIIPLEMTAEPIQRKQAVNADLNKESLDFEPLDMAEPSSPLFTAPRLVEEEGK